MSSCFIHTAVAWIWPEPNPAARLATGRDAHTGLPSIPNSHVGAALLWTGKGEWGRFWEQPRARVRARHQAQDPARPPATSTIFPPQRPLAANALSLTSTLWRSTKLLGHTGFPSEECFSLSNTPVRLFPQLSRELFFPRGYELIGVGERTWDEWVAWPQSTQD